MIGGIDSIVDKKVDANRANPQRLEQSYSRNKELLDLLALQKLKSEKDAAARDMQMKAEQMPGTIAEQMEKEMLEQTKNDMVEQTAGIMDQRRQKAAAQAKQMGQPPQRPAGIAGMAPQGMPGFQDGGSVDAASDEEMRDVMSNIRSKLTVEKVRQLIQEGKLTKAQFSGLVDSLPAGQNKSEIVEFLETQHGFEPKDDPTKISPEEMDDIDAQIATQSAPEEEAPAEIKMPELGDMGLPKLGERKEGLSGLTTIPSPEKKEPRPKQMGREFPTAEESAAARAGITEFFEGSPERQLEIQEYQTKRKLKREGKSPEEIEAAIADLRANFNKPKAKPEVITEAPIGNVKAELGITDADTGVMDGMTTGGGSIADMGGAGVLRKQEAGQQASPQASPEPSGIAAPAVTELDPTKKAAAGLAAVSDTRVTDALQGTGVNEFIQEGMGKSEADMATARDAEELRLALKYGRLKEDPKNPGKYIKGDTIARMDKYTSDYEKMMGEVQDPEKQRFERSQAQLRGIGRGGAGGGATGIAAERRRQEGERERAFLKRVELDKASIDKNAELIGKEIAAGADVYKSIKEDKRAAATLAMNLGKANLERYDAQYKQILDAASATIKNQLTAQANEIDRQYKMSMIKSADSKTLAALYGGLAAQRKAIGEVITKMYDNVDVPPTAKALEVAITQAIEDANIPAIEKAIIARISTLSGVPLAEAEQQIGDEKEFEDLTGNVMDQLRAMAN